MPLDPEIADSMARVPDDEWMRLAGQSPADARAHYRAVTLERRGEDYAPQALGSVTDTTFPGPAGPLAARLYEPDDLAGLPPAVITVAESDPLRDEAVLYAQRLRQAGVGVTLIRGAGLVHGYFGMTSLSAAAARTAAEVRAAFAALLH